MDVLQKNQILDKLIAYHEDKKSEHGEFSQNQLAKAVGISASYMTPLMKRDFERTNKEGNLILTDNIWQKISDFLNRSNESWDIPNYGLVMTRLLDAKRHHYPLIFDGSTGVGKTYGADLFRKKFPKNTFYIKCAFDMSIKQFVKEMARVVGISADKMTTNRYQMRINICEKLLSLPDSILIIDETEKTTQNAKLQIIDTLQAMYDYKDLFKSVSLVVMGANGFYSRLKSIAENRQNPHAIPQFLSRWKPVFMEDYSTQVAKGVCRDHYGIKDKEMIKELVESATDYRELAWNIKEYLNDKKLVAA